MKKNGTLSGHDIKRVQEAAQILAKYLSQNITIKDLAGIVLLSEKKLKQGFKEEFEMGVHAYLRYLRLEKVKAMLIQDKPLKAIPKATGFKSESGLSKTFKKVVGVTPGEWKLNYQRLDRAV
ncbi:helix-turn-helix transcriptional regulator [Niastella caeni]|uniref:Helix-turn-helix transcriptional regulator n=1 Tax=Niastella caeni TaxID=2569763 RepID=A0A4S8HUR8_9BACT|nr:AraC family transcriptional regulator [Niastella caeni]THU39310.1 helix-turn-helix transcriptional regulator [Niastella caeni]